MPRVVDHDERRRELAEAAISLVLSEGAAALSVRNLASASGWSAGAVRHYLPTHDDIIDLVSATITAGFERRLRAVPDNEDPRAWLLSMVTAALPLDQESRRLSQAWFAFLGAEVHQPRAGAGALVYDELAGVLTALFTQFEEQGVLRGGTPREATVVLQSMLDGLTVHLLMDRITGDEAMHAVRRGLQNLLGPSDDEPRHVPVGGAR